VEKSRTNFWLHLSQRWKKVEQIFGSTFLKGGKGGKGGKELSFFQILFIKEKSK